VSKEKPDSNPLTDEQRAAVQAGVDAVNAQNNGTTAEVVTDEQAEEQFAERFMVGELIKAATKQLKDSQVAFRLLTEREQSSVLQRVADDVRPIVLKAIQIIKSHGRVEFKAECKQVVFKGATDVQATLAMVIHDGAHALADQAGQTVTVVIDNLDEMLSVGDSTRGDPDQPSLLDDEI